MIDWYVYVCIGMGGVGKIELPIYTFTLLAICQKVILN